jgi:hypothetical protein
VRFFTRSDGRSQARLSSRAAESSARVGASAPQRSGFIFVDETGERTSRPSAKTHPRDDGCSVAELARCDAVYFCAGDADALCSLDGAS